MTSTADLLRELERALAGAGVESPNEEARWLLEAATGQKLAELVTARDIDVEAVARAQDMTRRRVAGEPLQYVTGEVGFRHLDLRVGPGVFIPRPETEVLVDVVLDLLPPDGIAIDIGTGSGAIALSIAHERADARVVATERSPEALEYARLNRERTGAGVELVQGDLFSPVSQELRGIVDVVVSNPPYVSLSEKHVVAPDVLAHEPHEALFGGDVGMEVVQRLSTESPQWLRRGGWLVFEIGASQLEVVEGVLRADGFDEVDVTLDLAGRSRIVRGRLA